MDVPWIGVETTGRTGRVPTVLATTLARAPSALYALTFDRHDRNVQQARRRTAPRRRNGHEEPPMPHVLALALLAPLVLWSCAGSAGGGPSGAPRMTIEDFREYCSALPTPTACLSDPICDLFATRLGEPRSSLSECLEMCRHTEQRLSMQHVVDGCGGTVERAADFCAQYCRRHY